VLVAVTLWPSNEPTLLSWAPPTLSQPRTHRVTNDSLDVLASLDPGRDYRIVLPDEPIVDTVNVVGGRNVVLIGGEIKIENEGPSAGVETRYGFFLKNQTGTIHLEGVRIHGADLVAGVVLDQGEGATVQLQHIRIEDVHARDNVEFTDSHPDVIQTWRGPRTLRIDRLTGTTAAVGLQFQPHEYERQQIDVWEIRRTNLRGSRSPDRSRHLLWKNGAEPWWRQRQDDVWVQPAPGREGWGVAYPSEELWEPFNLGEPPDGDFVPRGSAGIGYVSAGYRDDE